MNLEALARMSTLTGKMNKATSTADDVTKFFLGGMAAAAGTAAAPQSTEAGTFGETVLDSIKQRNEALAAAAEDQPSDNQAQPVKEPQQEKQVPPMTEWTEEDKNKFINESGIDETPQDWYRRTH